MFCFSFYPSVLFHVFFHLWIKHCGSLKSRNLRNPFVTLFRKMDVNLICSQCSLDLRCEWLLKCFWLLHIDKQVLFEPIVDCRGQAVTRPGHVWWGWTKKKKKNWLITVNLRQGNKVNLILLWSFFWVTGHVLYFIV